MANIELDGPNKKIKVDSGDLTLDVPGDIVLDADGGDVVFADGGTNLLKVTNSSSDVVLQPQVDTKDIVFKQYDGTVVATVEDNATFNIPASKLAIGGTAVTSTAAELNILDGVTSTAAELNIMDGVTSTASELNLLDGGTSVGSSITVADADGFVVNDGGTMKTIPATDLKTYAGSAYAPDNWQYFVISANQTMSAGASTTISGWVGGAINGRLIYNFGNQYVSESSGIFSFSTEGYYRVILRVSGSTAGATDSSGYIFTTTDNSAYGDAVDVNFSKTSGTGFNFYVDTILKITNTTNHKVKTGIYAATNNVTVAGHGGNATRQRTYLRFERLGTAS